MRGVYMLWGGLRKGVEHNEEKNDTVSVGRDCNRIRNISSAMSESHKKNYWAINILWIANIIGVKFETENSRGGSQWKIVKIQGMRIFI